MSWSFSVPATAPDAFLAALGSAEAVGNAEASAERDEQVVEAKAAVTMLFDSGALCSAAQPGSLIGCIVSGHAQPAHTLTGRPEDFGSENVVINLYRIVDPVPAPAQPVVAEQPVAETVTTAPVDELPGGPDEPEPTSGESETSEDDGAEVPEPAAEVSEPA